jgi:hypothetical protein
MPFRVMVCLKIWLSLCPRGKKTNCDHTGRPQQARGAAAPKFS